MSKRKIFYSFEHDKDCARATQIKAMGDFDENSIFPDEEWKEVLTKTDDEIKAWIDSKMKGCDCLLVLVGENTHEDKWVNYEIKKAVDTKHMGIMGIYVQGLKDENGNQCKKGKNPFDSIHILDNKKLSSIVPCFDSDYATSPYVAEDISNHIDLFMEHSLANRKNF